MNGISAGNQRGTDNIRNIQIAFAARARPDTDTFICHTHRQRIAVGLGMSDNTPYTHLATGPDNPQRDFTTVSNQNFTKHCHEFGGKDTHFGYMPH